MLSTSVRPFSHDPACQIQASRWWKRPVRVPLGSARQVLLNSLPRQIMLLGLTVVLVGAAGLRAEDAILAPGDLILATDTDLVPQSAYPTTSGAYNDERPVLILDNDTATKYLNWGKEYSGFIVTPTHGASAVQSMIITTANDAPERDPSSFEIYGTNEPILSGDNTSGTGETWTLIATGTLELPADRLTAGPVATFANAVAYSSYKVLFPTIKDTATADSMQIAEVGFFTSADGSGANVLSEGGVVLAVDADGPSAYPIDNEGPANILDNTAFAKYLNSGGTNSGFIVTPTRGASTVQSMVITTANDAEERDPASYEIYGTNAAIASTDNSTGTAESWTLIASGTLALPTDRLTVGPAVSFANTTSYKSYKVLFPTLKGATTLMQIAEVAMHETADATGADILDRGGVVLAVDSDTTSQSSYAAANSPPQAIDGNIYTHYANDGGVNSGFIVTPSVGLSIATSFKITTSEACPECDPTAWTLYGTVDTVVSSDNSTGTLEHWVAIASGTVSLPSTRLTEGTAVSFSNSTAYTSYRMVITGLRDAATATAMRIAEIQFYGTIVSSMPDQLLSPGDFIIAIDIDPDGTSSSYPTNESPKNILDNATGTKYLNRGGPSSGFIVTPASGAAIVQSMTLATANDAETRDPSSYTIYGTNEAILSTDNSAGSAENWTQIATGTVTLPSTRLTAGTVVSFANSTAYTSYKVLFPTLKGAGETLMQIADVALFTSTDGTGTSVTKAGDTILAIDFSPSSSYPTGETPANAIDRVVTNTSGGSSKYLNFGENNSGFIVKPSIGSTVATSFKFITANDSPERDPAGWALYGTNDAIVDVDNSHGSLENWTLIASGTMELPTTRHAAGPMVSFSNTVDYAAYRMVITTVRNATTANSMQFAEVQFYGIIGVSCNVPFADADGDKDVDQADFAVYQLCFTGQGGIASSRECRCMDRDKDTDVDELDFAAFMNCATGPAIAWTQESTPKCVP